MSGQINNFYDLQVWQKSTDLVVEIYKITITFPKEEMFGLTSQIKRSAISIPANISEGFERFHYKDKTKFYYQAGASLSETQNHLFIAEKLNFITKEQLDKLLKEKKIIHKMLNSLIKTIKNKI